MAITSSKIDRTHSVGVAASEEAFWRIRNRLKRITNAKIVNLFIVTPSTSLKVAKGRVRKGPLLQG
jgi:hypothetical protein